MPKIFVNIVNAQKQVATKTSNLTIKGLMSYTEKFFHLLNTLPDFLVYLLLGLSAFVENIFPPIPGDTITAFGAFLVGTGRLGFFWVYISTTMGSLFGFMFLFWVGSYLGRRFFIEKDYRLIKAKQIIKAEDWYRKHGYLLIGINRFLPGIRSVISVAGGDIAIKGNQGHHSGIIKLCSVESDLDIRRLYLGG